MEENTETHFGYQKVSWSHKKHKVAEVFDSVADKYDIMNDFMSFGIHRLWKKIAVSKLAIRPNDTILDLAGGTGDLSLCFAKKISNKGKIILSDINKNMLDCGRDKLINAGFINNIDYLLIDAENIPFRDNSIDKISIAFGLRNVTNKPQALQEMYRVLSPGGKVVILEFSKLENEYLKKMYDLYSFNVLPTLGKLMCNDQDSYKYLAESIRMHPNQEELKNMLLDAGFEDCEYQNLSFGITAIHIGYKF